VRPPLTGETDPRLEWFEICHKLSFLAKGQRLTLDGVEASRGAGETYVSITAQTIQLHGGIGFTWEHDARLFFKRARASAVLLGTAGELTDLTGRQFEAII
jgi:alkylation response protein AidB-like acyl-CoA dehydrogenase